MDRARRFRSAVVQPARGARTGNVRLAPVLVWRKFGRSQRHAIKERELRLRLLSVRSTLSRRPDIGKNSSVWQRAGLIVLFAIMAGAGFGAYAGYARMVRAPGGESVAHVQHRAMPPSLWIRTPHPLTTTRAPDEMGAWLSKAGDYTAVAAIVVFADVADAVACGM